MSRMNSWSGNNTTEYSINGGYLNKLTEFCKLHEGMFLFGNGKIGKAFMHYLEQSEIPCAGFVTSDTLTGFKQEYKSGKTGVVIDCRSISTIPACF